MEIPSLVLNGISLYIFLTNLACCIAFLITFGKVVKEFKFTTGSGVLLNLPFTEGVFLIMFSLLTLLGMGYEVYLVFKQSISGWTKFGYVRASLYLIIGLLVLGCAANLGIAFGALEFFSAAVVLTFTLLIKFEIIIIKKVQLNGSSDNEEKS